MNRWFIPSILLVISSISVVFINSLVPELTSKHLLAIILGFVVFVTTTRLPIQQVFRRPWHLYLFTCILLLIPLFLPVQIRGTSRWIPIIGSFRLQPSQIAFALIGISISSLTVKFSKDTVQNIKSTAKQLGLIIMPTLLIAVAPNLGTAVFFFFCMSMIIFFSGIPWKHIALLLAGVICFGYIAWLFLLQPYQKQRITTFLQPSEASQNETYNVRQSLIAIGAGGLSGSGFGKGSQSQLRFLPEKHTDFVFAAFSEEFGFIGSALLVLIYLVLSLYLLKESYSIQSLEQKYFVLFTSTIVFFQAMINISTNIGLLPVTGITLPFFSYGGTSFIAFGLIFGTAQNCIQKEKRYSLLHIV